MTSSGHQRTLAMITRAEDSPGFDTVSTVHRPGLEQELVAATHGVDLREVDRRRRCPRGTGSPSPGQGRTSWCWRSSTSSMRSEPEAETTPLMT